MAIQLFYLTAQIQRWLNSRVAHHLEAQATRLTRQADQDGDGQTVQA